MNYPRFWWIHCRFLSFGQTFSLAFFNSEMRTDFDLPKKMQVGGVEVIDWVRRMQGKSIAGQDIHIDWPELMNFKCTFTDPLQDREGP